MQALAEAALSESQKSPDTPVTTNQNCAFDREAGAAVTDALSSTARVRHLFCQAHCLLGRLIEWRDPAAAMLCYNQSVCVHPCFESYFQQGRLLLKLATSQKQMHAAQQASTVPRFSRAELHVNRCHRRLHQRLHSSLRTEMLGARLR